MAKKSDRLNPLPDVLRELFLKSGNQCAFPGCSHLLMSKEGVFIGETCHIEAAEKGGPRFNENLSPEDRRVFGNLMLMCHAHHKVTDDVDKYTVQVLKDMKAKHEDIFSNPGERILQAFVDQTTIFPVVVATSTKKFASVLGWDLNEEQLAEQAKHIQELAVRLQKIPIRTRSLLLIIVVRAGKPRTYKGFVSVPLREIAEACQIPVNDVTGHVEILNRYRFTEVDAEDQRNPIIHLRHLLQGEWAFWNDLRTYCEKTGISLLEIVVDLKFNLLD